MSGIDIRRVVSLWAKNAGSGYLIGRDLVLTAAHCVGGVGDPVQVRAMVPVEAEGSLRGTPPVEFRVAATGGLEQPTGNSGFAILSSVQKDPFRFADLAPIRWGRLTGRSSVAAETEGFPRLADAGGRCNVEHALGKLIPDSGAREIPSATGGTWSLAFQVESGTPEVHVGGGALWQGASGSAVFSGSHLLGVLSEYQPTMQGRLKAIPVELLVRQPSLFQLLEERTGKVIFEPVWAGDESLDPSYTTLEDSWSAADLLRSRYNVVPFSGRDAELTRLRDWCLSSGIPEVSVLLMTGNGAVGKTRLARELCDQMIQRGWVAGLLSPLASGAPGFMELDEDRLIVVDDADVRVGHLDALLKERQGGHRLRVLAIARHKGDWWKTIHRRYDDLVRHPGLELFPPDVAERKRVYEDAWEAFHRLESTRRASGPHAGSATGPALLPKGSASADLTDSDFESYLFILILALIDVRRYLDPEWQAHPGLLVTRAGALYDKALDLEREDWIACARNAGLPTDPVLLDRVVAVASLAYAGGDTDGHSETEAARLLRLVPDLADASEQVRRGFVRAFQERIGGYGALRPLRPQRLAEHLAAKMIWQFPEVAAQLLEFPGNTPGSPGDKARQALYTLQLLSAAASDEVPPESLADNQQDQRLYQALREALRLHGPGLVSLVTEVLDTADDAIARSLASTLATVFRKLPADKIAADTAERLDEDPPDVMLGLAVILQEKAAEFYSTQQHDLENRRRLGETHKRLSMVLAESGRRRDAYDHAWQSVEHFNAIVRTDDSDEYLLGKAHSLSSLTEREYDIGQFEESLEPAREAVRLYEDLMRRSNDQVHHVHLSFALCHLARSLAHLGRWREALQAATEAVDLAGSDLPHESGDHSAEPADITWAQAFAHFTLACRLPDAGKRLEAIEEAEQACALYQKLTEQKPDRWRRDHARSLAILGRKYAVASQWDLGIETITKALGIYQNLEHEYQEAERARHAHALRYLADAYLGKARGNGSDRADALACGLQAADEALRHFEHLSAEDAHAQRTNWAVTKRIRGELTLELGTTESLEEALKYAQEIVTTLRDHFSDHTWKGRRNLARAHVFYGKALAQKNDIKAATREMSQAWEILHVLDVEEPGLITEELQDVAKRQEELQAAYRRSRGQGQQSPN